MKIKFPSITMINLELRNTIKSTMYENIEYISAYNTYYINTILGQGGFFTNNLNYKIHDINYNSLQNVPYDEVSMFLDIDSPFIEAIETIYNNSEERMIKLQNKYNKKLHINDITNIIRQEQKKVLQTNTQIPLFNEIVNEQYEKMGYIENMIELRM